MTHNGFDTYDYVDFDSVVKTFENLYIKTYNEILARHLLADANNLVNRLMNFSNNSVSYAMTVILRM